jgi:putative protein-disulfide isomerase
VYPIILYCYDAYCSWCYGFSAVITKIEHEYRNRIDFEVLSGGMILPAAPKHISILADHMKAVDRKVESLTGISFGADYTWHLDNPDSSDWYPNSEKPAIALCVLKTYYPLLAIQFAADLQYALHFEGRDLCDDEAYRHLLEKYNIPSTLFYQNLHSPQFKEQAYEEFALCRQLKVAGFPAVFMQVAENKMHVLAEGFTDYNTLKSRIEVITRDIVFVHQQ